MRLIGLAVVLAVSLLALLAVEAQQPVQMYRIGFLAGTSANAVPLPKLREGLREIGYVEGKNIVFEYRFAEDQNERLPGLAAELVRSRVDIIVAHGSPAILAVKEATRTIPVVMVGPGDPVGTGFVASLARPGGNITGVSNTDVGVAAKRLELLKAALPKLSRVIALRNPTNPAAELLFRETQAAARTLGIEIHLIDVRDPGELERAFSMMAKARAEALIVIADPMFLSQRARIANLAMTKRLPSVFARNENVEAGGLLSYGAVLGEVYRHAATYVDKILKGAKPGDLPVEQPTKFELVINLKTAKALGLTIPQSVLSRADEVIQ
jgi:putative ABC transport system substrate-binding protein